MSIDLDVTIALGPRTLRPRLRTSARRVAIVGPSGVGKTSLLRAIVGVQPASGPIEIDGRRLDLLPVEQRRVGWAPQSATLFPHLDVGANLAFASSEKPIDRIAELVSVTPLLARAVGTLSGGERQRVAIGRALARTPRVLVLDEPLSALERAARGPLSDAIELERARIDATLLFASHDELDVSRLADEVYEMSEDGALRSRG